MALPPIRSAKRLLFAWEAGANLGHIMPLVRMARRFTDDQYECLIAARDLPAAYIALENSGLTLLQAPVWPLHTHLGNEDGQSGYLDVLATMGFGDPAKLTPILQAWNALLDLVAPDAVIADHCPALIALLNARRIPTIAIGSGFTMPPASYPSFPPIRADRSPLLPEARLHQSLVEALAGLGYPAPASLKAALTTSQRLVFSFPELDPYRGWRQETLHLPPDPLPACIDPPLEPHLFVYVGGELPGLTTLVQCLAELPCKVECYLRSAPAPLSAFLRLRGIKVHDKPPNLGELLPQVSHVLSQGGTGLCHAVMAAGRPHIIIPLHGESEMNFYTLCALGIARRFPPNMKADELKDELDKIIGDHQLIVNALQWGRTMNLRPQSDGAAALETAVQCLLQPETDITYTRGHAALGIKLPETFVSKMLTHSDLAQWEKNGRPVPPPHIVKQRTLLEYSMRYNLRVLVESGTYNGTMVEAMRAYFDRIYSIELDKDLYEKAMLRFKGANNVELIHGDSGSMLTGILSKIRQPALFWLDGHYSGGVTARGTKDTPIYEELDHILNSTDMRHVIIIDDARYFGKDPAYPTIDEFSKFVKSKRSNVDIVVQDDSIRITPK